mmetsp:Transcript_31333/g.58313  ORF Transcript_31333/g.58313 Transcript_31333/m.58313 type:complete len:874 (+) Transcript_31333:72-2693(+)
MKRQRTLSGIRAALDYKNLNVFGDIVGNFHGCSVPSVEEFNSYLQSHDSCDNLKNLPNQSVPLSNKSSENTGNEKAKRGRKPKKRYVDDDDVISEEASGEPPSVLINSTVIGAIGDFFQRFIQKYPPETSVYNKFVQLSKAYEGKVIDEKTFYSAMKDLLVDDENNFLSEFSNLIRPEDSDQSSRTFEAPSTKHDFPFNTERKRSMSIEYNQFTQQHHQPISSPPPYTEAITAPAHTLSNEQVSDLVRSAVDDKAKEFLQQAKSSMDPHTYVSFLDIMVELRCLYKANEIEDAIEKLDIAKGILTRVNPQLRVELDRYFPIVNANGARHNLEHHTFEQSQRQYREWQQAQVARKQMQSGDGGYSSTSPNDNDTRKDGAQSKEWWSDISMTSIDHAQQKKDRMKISAYEKEQIQNAKRLAKENAAMKNNRADTSAKEDLLDALSANSKPTKKRAPAANARGGGKGSGRSGSKVGGGGVHGGEVSSKGGGRGRGKRASATAGNAVSDSRVTGYPYESRPQGHISQNVLPELGNYQQGDHQNFSDFVQFMHQQQQQNQQQQNQQQMGHLSGMQPMMPMSSNRVGDSLDSTSGVGGYHNTSISGNGISSYPFASNSMSVLPPHPSMMNSYGIPTMPSSMSDTSQSQSYQQQHLKSLPQSQALPRPPPQQQHQFSSYGPPQQQSQQQQQQQNIQHSQHQQNLQRSQQSQQSQNQQQVNYTPAFQPGTYGSLNTPSMHMSSTTSPPQGSTRLPPPPSQGSSMGGVTPGLLPSYSSAPMSRLPSRTNPTPQSQPQSQTPVHSPPQAHFSQQRPTQSGVASSSGHSSQSTARSTPQSQPQPQPQSQPQLQSIGQHADSARIPPASDSIGAFTTERRPDVSE